jgi:hypothetical protein
LQSPPYLSAEPISPPQKSAPEIADKVIMVSFIGPPEPGARMWKIKIDSSMREDVGLREDSVNILEA